MIDSSKLAEKAQALQANSMLLFESNLQACWLYANRLLVCSASSSFAADSGFRCSRVGVMVRKLDPNNPWCLQDE